MSLFAELMPTSLTMDALEIENEMEAAAAEAKQASAASDFVSAVRTTLGAERAILWAANGKAANGRAVMQCAAMSPGKCVWDFTFDLLFA